MSAKRILVADDEPGIRLLVRNCLESAGYEISQACDGVEVVELANRFHPDLILLDLSMPRKDGMTALAELQLVDRQQATRVIVMTANGSVQSAIKALRLGASDFIEKPFLPDDLRLSVASVLEETPVWLRDAGESYDQVLRKVREALRGRNFAAAEALLMRAGTIADDDPAFLNLAGVLHESHGRLASARRFYERSAARETSDGSAKENLRRLDDLARSGRTLRGVVLGEEVNATKNFH